jgi:hypothetical protein
MKSLLGIGKSYAFKASRNLIASIVVNEPSKGTIKRKLSK